MRKNKFKIIGMILLIMIISIGFSGCKNKYVKYDNIDNVGYAEPTEYAKNFDIEGYISKLPEVKYKKIDYPIKETYTYKFNNYEMTIDIPEGFEVKKIPLKEKPKIVNSTSVEDSCHEESWRATPNCGDEKGFFMDGTFAAQASDSLEIISVNNEKCGTMYVTSSISGYKGISTWDSFVRYIIPIISYDKKYQDKEGLFLVHSPKSKYERYSATKLLNDKKYILAAGIKHDKLCIFDDDLFFSILDSMKIKKVK